MVAILLLTLLWAQAEGWAQASRRLPEAQPVPATAAALMKAYNVADTEFVLGAYVTKFPSADRAYPGYATCDEIWTYLHSLGCNVMYVSAGNAGDEHNYPITFAHTAGAGDRMMLVDYVGGPAAFGRDVELYPWDSAETDFYKNKFLGRYGGATVYNNVEKFRIDTTDYLKHEQRYATANGDTAGERILWQIAYGYQPQMVKRYPSSGNWREPDSIQNSYAMSEQRAQAPKQSTYYLAVTGHLASSPNTSVALSEPVLRIEIWNEIPRGTTYVDSSGVTRQDDTANHEFLYATIDVPKDSLTKLNPLDPFAKYRTPAFSINLDRCTSCMGGPLRNQAQRWDVRLIWTGKEEVFLRSVSIRDSLGQLVDGYLPQRDSFRLSTYNTARYWLYGWYTGLPDSLPASIIGLGAGTEATPLEYRPFATLNKMVQDSFNLARKFHRAGAPGDSLGIWQYDQAGHVLHQFGNLNYTHRYSYLNDPRDSLAFLNEPATSLFDIPLAQMPAIRPHNGGRFHVPMLLDLDSLGIPRHDTALARRIEDYESVLQESFLGKFYPDGLGFPYAGRIIPDLGDAATVFRRTGARLIQVPGVIASLDVRAIGGAIDTLAGRFPEPTELLTIVNLGLCYGSRGVSWWRFADEHNPYTDSTIGADGIPWYSGGNACCVGGNGKYLTDTTANYIHLVHSWDGPSPAIIRNYYVGWRDRIDATRAITINWLKNAGPIMAKLRWRNSYSIYSTTQWHRTSSPGSDTLSSKDIYVRPLPSTEIVNDVHSRSVMTGVVDSTWRTFVEIGLFDVRRDSNSPHDPFNDTNYVMVVNRRSFEPPRTAREDTTRDILDTLAEHRTITLKLHCPAADSTGYNWVHVKDLFPSDTTWLADNGGWSRIDTVVAGDSIVTLTLAPGRAALLQISPALPWLTGDTRFNNQRKLLYDGRRYHAVYHRYNGNESTSFYDTVFYRRSLPLADSTSPILWESVEHAVSVGSGLGDATRVENRFPSMTLRTGSLDTTITFVWTSHGDATHAAQREIVTRDFRYGRHYVGVKLSPYEIWSPIAHIDWHYGLDPITWGTPVISRVDASEIIVWSDSVSGIVARARLTLDSVRMYANVAPKLSANLAVSQSLTTTYGVAGIRPSVPPFAHVAGHDSSCALVWQQQLNTTFPYFPYWPNTDIMYVRLKQDSVIPTGVRLTALGVPFRVNYNPGLVMSPCVDQTQDARGLSIGVQDGVVWENIEPYYSNGSCINFRPIRTNGTTSAPSGFVAQFLAYSLFGGDYLWPSTASLNRVMTLGDSTQEKLFAVAYESSDVYDPMWQALINWDSASFKSGWPHAYGSDGWVPNTSAAPVKQSTRQAAFYRATEYGYSTVNSTLTTTREFFYRVRPRGYVADGRSVLLRIRDSLKSGMVVGMHDIWLATASGGQALAMTWRSPDLRQTDSIGQVTALMRTGYFTASDSVTLGGTYFGELYGDASVDDSVHVDCVAELVDSATGSVIAKLDSFTVSRASDSSFARPETELDLLRGTYYVRLRLVSSALPSDTAEGEPRYPVTEIASYIRSEHLGKLSRSGGGSASMARISAQPNPMIDGTELRFSIPSDAYVTVRVLDPVGREVLRPLDHAWTGAGRYAIGLEGSTSSGGVLSDGTYIVSLDAGALHASTKLVVRH